MNLRTPGMRQEGSLRPAGQGSALSKDVWLLSRGTSLIVGDPVEDKRS